MRRLLSITLLLVLSLPLFASVFGSAQAESRLPLCCRRGGAHACAGMSDASGAMSGTMSMPRSGDRPVVRMACTAYPPSLGQVHTGGWSFTATPAMADAAVVESFVAGQVEAGFRISQGRAWQKRGPPQERTAS